MEGYTLWYTPREAYMEVSPLWYTPREAYMGGLYPFYTLWEASGRLYLFYTLWEAYGRIIPCFTLFGRHNEACLLPEEGAGVRVKVVNVLPWVGGRREDIPP